MDFNVNGIRRRGSRKNEGRRKNHRAYPPRGVNGKHQCPVVGGHAHTRQDIII